MRGKPLSSFVPSSFMELTFCMHLCDGHEDVSLRGLTKGNSSINNSSCYALKSITTFLTMAMLPHAAPQCLLHTTRTSSSGTPGGPTSPWMGSLGSMPPAALLYFHSGFLPSFSPLLGVRPPPAFQLCPRFLCLFL